MDKKSNASVNKIVQIDEAQIHHHLDRVVQTWTAITWKGGIGVERDLCLSAEEMIN